MAEVAIRPVNLSEQYASPPLLCLFFILFGTQEVGLVTKVVYICNVRWHCIDLLLRQIWWWVVQIGQFDYNFRQIDAEIVIAPRKEQQQIVNHYYWGLRRSQKSRIISFGRRQNILIPSFTEDYKGCFNVIHYFYELNPLGIQKYVEKCYHQLPLSRTLSIQ